MVDFFFFFFFFLNFAPSCDDRELDRAIGTLIKASVLEETDTPSHGRFEQAVYKALV